MGKKIKSVLLTILAAALLTAWFLFQRDANLAYKGFYNLLFGVMGLAAILGIWRME